MTTLFYDRIDAANRLAVLLRRFRSDDGVVLAIPRGGVPLGRVIADDLNWPLDVILTKKIGHPENPEYAIGAVSLESVVVDPRHSGIPSSYIQEQTEKIRQELKRRQFLFSGKSTLPKVTGKTVILVDDGIATGHTMLASIQLIRNLEPARIVVAVPVSAPEALRKIEDTADECICLLVPDDFFGVGQYYENFEQVDDEEVKRLLR